MQADDLVVMLPLLWRDEIKVLTVPLDAELEAAESISAATFTVTVLRGTDATPAGVLVGTAQVVGRDVLQRVQWQAPGVVYELRCKVTGSTGLRHVVVGRLTAEA